MLQRFDLTQETELSRTVSSTENMHPPDESLREVIEVNEPTDSEVQETMRTGSEIGGDHLTSSDQIDDEDQMDMSTDVQDLEGRTEPEVNTKGESCESVNLRCSSRIPKPPKKFYYPQMSNPLTSVVQNLFQSLCESVANSILLTSCCQRVK